MPKVLSSPKLFESFQELLKGWLHLGNLKIYVAGLCIISNLYKLQFPQFPILNNFASSKVRQLSLNSYKENK